MDYKIIGLRVEKYLGTVCEGHNCDFDYSKEERERHVLLLKGYDDYRELTLSYEEGECGSGWCTASFGEYELKTVKTFAGKTHKPVKELTLDLGKFVAASSDDSFQCETFYFSEDGGCCYYPSGSYNVNMGLFEPLRTREKRPVYVFKGDSNLGKSHIGALTGKTIMDTDSCDSLPDKISDEIIIIGNKHGYSLEDITSRVYNLDMCEIIVVDFSKFQSAT